METKATQPGGSTPHRNTAAAAAAPTSSSQTSAATRRTSNASADNITPADMPAKVVPDAFQRPTAPIMSRGQRATAEETVKRRLTPAQYEAWKAERDAREAADAAASSDTAAASRTSNDTVSTGPGTGTSSSAATAAAGATAPTTVNP